MPHVGKLEGVKGSDLRDMSDKAKGRIGSGIVFLTSVTGPKVALLISITDDLKDRLHAGKLVSEIAPIVGGPPGILGGPTDEGGVSEASSPAARRTSSWVMRPCKPLPTKCAKSTPSLRASLRVDGELKPGADAWPGGAAAAIAGVRCRPICRPRSSQESGPACRPRLFPKKGWVAISRHRCR